MEKKFLMRDKGLLFSPHRRSKLSARRDFHSLYFYVWALWPLGKGWGLLNPMSSWSSLSCQPLWLGGRAAVVALSFLSPSTWWDRLLKVDKLCILVAELVHSSKLEVPVTGVWSWLTLWTLVSGYEIWSIYSVAWEMSFSVGCLSLLSPVNSTFGVWNLNLHRFHMHYYGCELPRAALECSCSCMAAIGYLLNSSYGVPATKRALFSCYLEPGYPGHNFLYTYFSHTLGHTIGDCWVRWQLPL